MKKYVADFETSAWVYNDIKKQEDLLKKKKLNENDLEELNKLKNVEAYVWAWAVCDIDNTKVQMTGNSIETFIDFCKEQNAEIYFHNLKFDGSYLLSWALRNRI